MNLGGTLFKPVHYTVIEITQIIGKIPGNQVENVACYGKRMVLNNKYLFIYF